MGGQERAARGRIGVIQWGKAGGGMRRLAIFSLAFAGATACAQYLLPLSLLPWAAGGFGLALLLCLLLRGDCRTRCCLLAAGLTAGFLYNFAFLAPIRRSAEAWSGEAVAVEAEVSDYAEYTGTRWRIRTAVLGGCGLEGMLYGGQELEDLSPGDRISGTMTVQSAAAVNDTPITSFTAKGIHLLLFPGETWTVRKGEPSLRYGGRYAARAAKETIDRLYGAEYAPFMRALLLGDRTGMSAEEDTALSEAGVYHITAVSGMHCGFLLALAAFFTGRHRYRLLAAVAIPLLWGYAALAGAPASMVRAAVMLTLLLLGPLLGRESDGITSLSFALLLLLLANPCAIAGAGLQLSFGAMAGLILLSPRIYRLFPHTRSRVLHFLWGSLSASFGVMAFTAPLSALYFNIFSLIMPLANLLVLWIAPLTFCAGVLSVAAGLVWGPVGMILALPGRAGAWAILRVSGILSRLPCHALYFTNPYLKYWLLFALLLFAFCALRRKKGRSYATAAGIALLTLALTAALPVWQRQGILHMAALDVGQGASTLLAAGGETVLVDCGSSNSYIDAGDRAGDSLNTWGYYRVDCLILTHYHADHVNGLETLFARLPVGEIYAPVPTAEDTAYQTVLDLAERWGAEFHLVREDQCLALAGMTLEIFAPIGSGGGNEEGLSILCSAGEFDALITGDMNSGNERVLAEKISRDLEVLVVGHHGSKNATDPALLDKLMPETALISVGENSYGHPAEETLQRITRRGMAIYRTDRQGNISLVLT